MAILYLISPTHPETRLFQLIAQRNIDYSNLQELIAEKVIFGHLGKGLGLKNKFG